MICAQRLKRVFSIDIETCEHCGGVVKVILRGGGCCDGWHLTSRPSPTSARTIALPSVESVALELKAVYKLG